jgi:hypothetical protein
LGFKTATFVTEMLAFTYGVFYCQRKNKVSVL